MQTKRYVAAAVVALSIGIGAMLALVGSRPTPAPQVGYTLLDGSTSATDQWRGKVVLVNFWATTCAVCLREMPQLVATHEKFRGRGFDTLAVAMRHDPPISVVQYASSRRLPFGIAIDHDGAIARAFGDVRATPTSVLINKRGEIVRRYVGEPDFAALQATVERLLSES